MKRIILCGGEPKYELIDFLKGFSIITIVLMHLLQSYITIPNLLFKASAFGGTGVHVFFFCSGFGLFLSNKNKKTTYIQFQKRRCAKIYIPYILVILISSFVPFMYKGNRLGAVLSHVFLYKMFVPQYESSFGGQMWYMSTLFQFYLLFLPLCWVKEKSGGRRKFCFVCFVTSVIWWIFTAWAGITEIRIWGSFFLQYLWEFAFGMAVADYLAEGNSIEIKASYCWIAAPIGLLFAAIAVLKGGMLRTFNDVPALFGYASVAILLFTANKNWINKTIHFFSKISYELYLVHILVFECVFRLVPLEENERYLLAIIALVISAAIAVLYKYFLNLFWKAVNTTTN